MSARRRRAVVLLAALALGAVPAADLRAQERPEPQLLLTIMGGATTGASLYDNLRQRLSLIEDPLAVDTLGLGRRLSAGLMLGASMTYFPGPNLGLGVEIVFLGLGRDDDCRMLYTAPSQARAGYNEAVCGDIAASGGSASTIGFYVGGLYRVAPRGGVKPYVRAQGGVALRNGSTVELTGRFVDQLGVIRSRLVIDDPNPGSISPSAAFGAGLMVPFAPGYQARLEIRDHLLMAERVTEAADALAVAPTEKFLSHSVGLVLMLDIVLEQKRGRRY